MSDLEMVKACAEAMGADADGKFWREVHAPPTFIHCKIEIPYDPLHDDAQAMALVKRFGLRMHVHNCIWTVIAGKSMEQTIVAEGNSSDLNRAVVECVAKLEEYVRTATAPPQ